MDRMLPVAADMALGPALLVLGIGALLIAIVVITVAVLALRFIIKRVRAKRAAEQTQTTDHSERNEP